MDKIGDDTVYGIIIIIIVIIQEIYKALPVAQSAEQYRLNTYMYIQIMNVIKKKKKLFIY